MLLIAHKSLIINKKHFAYFFSNRPVGKYFSTFNLCFSFFSYFCISNFTPQRNEKNSIK